MDVVPAEAVVPVKTPLDTLVVVCATSDGENSATIRNEAEQMKAGENSLVLL
jgi:hypothetical protein